MEGYRNVGDYFRRAWRGLCLARRASAPFLRNFWLFFGLFLALNWLDYENLGDIFRQGKMRYIFFALVPITFTWLKKELTWGPAFFAALALWSWVIHDYQYYSCLPLAMILGVMALAVCAVRAGEAGFARLLIVSGTLQALLALLQVCGVNPFFQPVESGLHEPIGWMGNTTVLGMFLVAAICPALWRRHYYAAFLMALAVVAGTESMACGALGAVATLYVWNRVTFRAAVFFALAGLGALEIWHLALPHNSFMDFHGRWFIWPFGLRAWREHPKFGIGIGGWVGHYIPLYKDEILAVFQYHVPRQLHCDFLDFLVEYGAIACGILGVAFRTFVRRFRPTWHHAVCAGLLVEASANFPLCLPHIALIFVVCWAFSNRVQ